MSDQQDLHRQLFETAGEALLVIQAGQIMEANAGAAALLGWAKEALLNQSLLHFSPAVQPDGCNSAQMLAEKMAAALAGPSQRFEWLCQTSTGETVPTEITLSGVESGGEAYLRASIHDISRYKQAEAELTRERNLLHSLIDKLPDTHAFVKDTASRFIFTNAAHLNVIGVDRLDQVLGKTDFDLFPQELAEQYFADEQAIIRSGQPLLNIVEPAVDSAGHKKWYLTNKLPLHDENDQVIGLVGMSLDITKRKEAEESLRQSQQLLQVVMDNIPQSIFWKDNNLTYLGCNRAFAEDAGLPSPEAIIGKTDYELVWREQADLYRADDRQVMEIGQPKLNYEEPQTTGAGTQIWLRTSKVPIHDAEGNVVAVLGMYEDITEQKQSEMALQESEQRLGDIIDFLPNPTFVIDREGKVIAWNHAIEEALGVKAEEILGKGNYEYALPFYGERRPILIDLVFAPPEEIEQKYTQVRRTGETLQAEAYVYPQGQQRYYVGTAAPLYDAEGKLAGAIETFRDITERKQVEEVLRQTNLVVQNSPVVLFRWRAAAGWPVEFVSENITQFGYTPAELLTGVVPFASIVHPDDLERVAQEVQEYSANGVDEFRQEYRIITKDGQVSWTDDRTVIERDSEGNITHYQGIVIDITERRRAEEALRQTHLVVESSPAVLFRWRAAADWPVEFVSENIAQFGYTSAELLSGETPYASIVHPDDLERVGQEVQEYSTSGVDYFPQEYRIITKDGQVRWTDDRTVIERDSEGNITHYQGILLDITERKRVEAELRQYQDRLEELVEARTVELEDRVRELNALQHLMSREGWQAFQSTREQAAPAYLFDQTSVRATTLEALQLPHNGLTQSTAAAGNGHIIAKPMAVQGEIIGALGIQNNSGEPLPPEDQAFLDAVAEQVAEALERARLLEQTQKRAVEMETVAQVSTVVSTILDTNQLLQEVADLTKERFGLYHAHIYLLNASPLEGGVLKLAAGAGEVGRRMFAQGWNIPFERERSLVARAARTRQTVVVADVRQNPDFMPNPLLPQTCSEMAVPLMVGDKVLGVLDVQADVAGRFTGDDVRIMTTLASQVAVALQNAGQYQQTEAALADVEQSQQLLRSIIDATPDWIFVKDREHRYRLVNQSYADSMHVSVEAFIGKDDLDIGFPEEIVKGNPEKGIRGFWADDREVMDSGQIRVIDVEPGVVDGRPVFLSTIKVPLRDASGDAWGVLGFVRDITQREQLLTEAANLYEASRRISQANNPQEIVAAVVEELAIPVINRALLVMFELDSAGELETMTVVANWYSGQGTLPTPVGVRYPKAMFAALGLLITSEPLFFDDIQHDERIDPTTLAILQQLNVHAMAVLPLWVGSRQLGSLLLEIEEVYQFTERDIRLNRSFISQAAVAIDNIRLLEETRSALAEVERTQRRYTVQAWEVYRDRLTTLNYEQAREGVAPLGDNLPAEITQVVAEQRQLIAAPSTDPGGISQPKVIVNPQPSEDRAGQLEASSSLIVPLTIRGETVGVLGLQEIDGQRTWSPEELALIEAISEELAQAAENIRLIDETQQRAAREKRVNEIGEKIQAAQSLEEALKIAVKEVGLSLQAPQTTVKLEVK